MPFDMFGLGSKVQNSPSELEPNTNKDDGLISRKDALDLVAAQADESKTILDGLVTQLEDERQQRAHWELQFQALVSNVLDDIPHSLPSELRGLCAMDKKSDVHPLNVFGKCAPERELIDGLGAQLKKDYQQRVYWENKFQALTSNKPDDIPHLFLSEPEDRREIDKVLATGYLYGPRLTDYLRRRLNEEYQNRIYWEYQNRVYWVNRSEALTSNTLDDTPRPLLSEPQGLRVLRHVTDQKLQIEQLQQKVRALEQQAEAKANNAALTATVTDALAHLTETLPGKIEAAVNTQLAAFNTKHEERIKPIIKTRNHVFGKVKKPNSDEQQGDKS